MGQDCQKISGELLEDIKYCIEGRTDEKEIKTKKKKMIIKNLN